MHALNHGKHGTATLLYIGLSILLVLLSYVFVQAGRASMETSKDQDRGKGAMEQDQQNQGSNTSMQGQLGHRDEDAEVKDADADLGG